MRKDKFHVRGGLADKSPCLTFTVETVFDQGSGKIEQSVTTMWDQTTKWIAHTRDKQVVEALIKLGWTPPA